MAEQHAVGEAGLSRDGFEGQITESDRLPAGLLVGTGKLVINACP
jgi:hypothetical protein